MITLANEAHHKQYGCGDGELLGRSILDFVADSEREKLRDYLKFLVKEQPPPSPYFGQKVTKDGRVIDVQVAWNYRRNQQGRLTGFTSFIADITGQKRVEEALRTSEERFRLAAAGTNEGVWNWNIITGKTYWSPRCYTLMDYEVDEIEATQDTFWALLHPDDKAATLEAVRAHIEDHVPYDIECRLRTKSGKYRWFRSRGQALWDETNTPQRFVGFFEDITEQRQLQAALRETQQLLDSTPDPVIIVNDKGGITFVNAQVGKTFGFDRAELLGKTLEVLVPERFHSQYRLWRTGFFSDPHVRALGIGLELHGRRKDGSEFPVEISLSPIKTETGLFVAAAVRDITERKRAEDRRRISKPNSSGYRSWKASACWPAASPTISITC